MTIKNSVLLVLGMFLCIVSYGQNEGMELLENYGSDEDLDEFYISLPQKQDTLLPFDTANIPSEYSHAILDKKVNFYSYFNTKPKGMAMVIKTIYIRNIEGVASLIDHDISDNKKYGITIFKKDGEKIHFTDELKEKEFDKKLRKEVRPGDIISVYYIYTLKQLENFSYFLSEVVPVHNATFVFQAEDKLEYTAKGLNGMNSSMDSTIEGFQILEFTGTNLPIVRDEKFTASNVSMAHVIYGLAYNRHYREDRLLDFTFASRYFQSIYKQEDLLIEKITSKIYPKLEIGKGDDDDTKAKKIDDYMKENFTVFSFSFNFSFDFDLKKIFGEDYLSPNDAVKYYVSLLRKVDVETEITFAPNRLSHKLDPEYETWEYLQYLMLYIPSTEKYLHPKKEYLRYGQMPPLAKDNEALYILDHSFGDIESSKFVLREIKANGYDENIESLHLSMDLTDLEKPASFVRTYQGDYAASFSNNFEDLFFDDKEDIFNNSCKLIDQNGVPTAEYSLNNSEEDSFTISGDFYAKGLIQNNGRALEIGKLLGKKEELSTTDKREAHFGILPQTKNVAISITLPQGKKATNLSDFNAKYSSTVDAPLTYQLSATQEGNVVTINLKEVFEKIVYDLDEYKDVKGLFDLANQMYTKKLLIE